jgi:hypothetical protein
MSIADRPSGETVLVLDDIDADSMGSFEETGRVLPADKSPGALIDLANSDRPRAVVTATNALGLDQLILMLLDLRRRAFPDAKLSED